MSKRWTEEEIKYLKNNHAKMNSEEIGNKLNRSANSVRIRASILELPKRQNHWAADEINYLKNNYTKMGYKQIANKLNRSVESVRKKIVYLNLPKKQNHWTEDENEYLKNNYTKMGYEEIGNKLNRSASSVNLEVGKLNLPRKIEKWTEDDEIYLEYFAYVGEDRLQEAADFLNRSREAVSSKLSDLRKKNNDVAYLNRKWTAEEDNYIKANYKSVTYQAIGLRLGRSRASVFKRARRLGLRKIRSLIEIDDEIRKMAADGTCVADIARELEIDYDTLRDYLRRHDISYKPMSTEKSLERARAKSPWQMYKFVIGKNRRQKEETK
ncbi:hypothetical protein JRB95_001381 [Listeria monocytogenes]|nr:hypothetical protein [Listeria monocytogenes]